MPPPPAVPGALRQSSVKFFDGSAPSSAITDYLSASPHNPSIEKFLKILIVGNSGVGKSFIGCYLSWLAGASSSSLQSDDPAADLDGASGPPPIFVHKVAVQGVTTACERACVVFPNDLNGFQGILIYNIPGLMEAADDLVSRNITVFKQAVAEFNTVCSTSVVYVMNSTGGRLDPRDTVAFDEAQKVMGMDPCKVAFCYNKLDEYSFDTNADWLVAQLKYCTLVKDLFTQGRSAACYFFPNLPKKPRNPDREDETLRKEREESESMAQVVTCKTLLFLLSNHQSLGETADLTARMKLRLRDRIGLSDEELEALDPSKNDSAEDLVLKHTQKQKEHLDNFEAQVKADGAKFRQEIKNMENANEQLKKDIKEYEEQKKKSQGRGFWGWVGYCAAAAAGLCVTWYTGGAVKILPTGAGFVFSI